MPEVGVFKGQFVANIFSLLFAAGRACLMPFLSIYFFYLGLSATQTGLLLGLKEFTSIWSSLCWAKYVSSPKRKRCVLIFSIMVLMLTHLAMMLMPSLNSSKSSSFCNKLAVTCTNSSGVENPGCQLNETFQNVNSSTTVLPHFSTNSTVSLTNFTPISSTPLHSSTLANISNVLSSTPSTKPAETTITITSTTLITVPATLEIPTVITTGRTDASVTKSSTMEQRQIVDDSDNNFVTKKHTIDFSTEDEEEDGPDEDSRRKRDEGNESKETEVRTFVPTSSEDGETEAGDNTKYGSIVHSLAQIQHQVFVALLVLVLVGEMFSSPTERLTEDLWLRFLDSFEQLDKRHIPKLWAALGSALTPWAVVLAIDRLPCVIPILQLPRILIHFFSFELIIALVLLIGFCYPVVETDGPKTKKWGRLFRGMRLVCGDVHSFVCMFTIVVVGFVYGFISTFLFWVMHIHSSTGSELPLGIALTVAATGEFLMSIVASWFVQKLKCPISIILGLTVLCARCLLYSFLYNPWFAVVGEAGHMLSHTIIWAAVQNYPAFRVNPLIMDTSAQTALGVVYRGFGLASGCMVAGLCYTWLGPQTMFQIAATISGAWCIVFAIVYKCCGRRRRHKVKYTKVSQEEMMESDESEDDWLNSAIKHQK